MRWDWRSTSPPTVMTTWPSFLLLLLAVALAMRTAKRPGLRLFFRAQLLYTLVLFMGYRLLGNHGDLYRAVYVGADLPVFMMAAILVAETGLRLQQYLSALIFGLCIACIGIYSAQRFSQDDWVCIVEGAYLSIIGMSMLLSEKWVLGVIGTLYLALGVFDFGYVRNGWESANTWLPSFLCIAAFSWIALNPRSMPAAHYRDSTP